MLLVGGVALIVIGPKDLPHVLRSLGQMTAKLKRTASEFQGQFHDAIRDADLEGTRKALQSPLDSIKSTVKDLTNNNPITDMNQSLRNTFQDIENKDFLTSQTHIDFLSEQHINEHHKNGQDIYDPYAALTPPHHAFEQSHFLHQQFSKTKTIPRGQLAHLERTENRCKYSRLKSQLKPRPKTVNTPRVRKAKYASIDASRTYGNTHRNIHGNVEKGNDNTGQRS